MHSRTNFLGSTQPCVGPVGLPIVLCHPCPAASRRPCAHWRNLVREDLAAEEFFPLAFSRGMFHSWGQPGRLVEGSKRPSAERRSLAILSRLLLQNVRCMKDFFFNTGGIYLRGKLSRGNPPGRPPAKLCINFRTIPRHRETSSWQIFCFQPRKGCLPTRTRETLGG
jgi:hypothetical protein